MQTTPRADVVQRSSRRSARFHTEYASPSTFVARTRARQFALALVFASHSKDAGSPRADTGEPAQLLAALAEPVEAASTKKIAEHSARLWGIVI